MTCHICNGPLRPYINDIFDDRYGYPRLFNICRCESCESFITQPPLKSSEIGSLYTDYYPRKNITAESVKKRAAGWISGRADSRACAHWATGEHRIHRRFPRASRPGMKVLDIGCGDGSSLLELRSLGYDACGIEADTNVGKIATELDLNIFIGMIEDAPFTPASFDCIIANQVIEHVVGLKSFMESIRKYVTPGGTVIFSTPNAGSMFRAIYGRKWIHWHIPYHQQILSKKGFLELANKYGYAISSMRTVSPSGWTMHEINRLRFEAQLGVKNPFWTQSEIMPSSLPGKAIRKGLFIFMSGLGKIADAFGYGNSFIVHMKIKR
jgi:2-polyprenyl-3-methyl-5-hydroxy-6-metoxy-1,4-benzoquinol methylase